MLRFYKKRAAIIEASASNKLVANCETTKYCVFDDYKHFLDTISTSSSPCFYEFIPGDSPVCPFFDIEIYQDSAYFTDFTEIIDVCKNLVISNVPPDYTMRTIVLESHSLTKRSFHLIFRIHDTQGTECLLESVKTMKEMWTKAGLSKYRDINKKYIIDPSVYREGLFRTIHSSKHGETRPLVKSALSDECSELESFLCYHTDNFKVIGKLDNQDVQVLDDSDVQVLDVNDAQVLDSPIVNIPEDLTADDKLTIKRFVTKEFHHFPNSVRDIFIDRAHNCIVVALTERYCPFLDREHRSNNQYIVIDTTSSKQKCHDSACNEDKYGELKLESYPKEINQIIKKCLRVNKQELELIELAIVECKNYITQNFDEEIKDVSFDRNAMIFRGHVGNSTLTKLLKGKCPECNVEHQIGDTGYCLKCTKCNAIFPKQHLIPVDNQYKTLNNFWSNYNQLVNNGTINNIINIYNGADIEFSCDIKLDNSIFDNKEVTSIVNQVLDGHKITMISKLLFTIHKNFVYSCGNWYFFNGTIWRSDNDNIEMKKEIIDLSKVFDRIKSHYDSRQSDDTTMSLSKNIKSIINKFHKPGFQDDVIKGAKIYFNNQGFINNLNSKKHLVPFYNGVFDLLENKYRKTKKDDFVNLTVNYDYNTKVRNPEVYKFLEQVLPNPDVRHYVLKKMSECLNGDIPNTNFLMFIGDSGANGKSQLLNLMKLTMGEFGEKVEVTLLTRKRNNANEANTEKIKLLNKRFAFLSEPEDGEKINIGLLKELTGSEEIVARGLYQDAVSFVMEAKLFLACNELPEIKGEDTALWRRIRVIDFPSRFIDEPKEPGEFKIDRTLPSRMREDVTWRQTFMHILLDYYNKNIPEPQEVKVKTNEYRQENNDFYNWLDNNITIQENGSLNLVDVCFVYYGLEKVSKSDKTKIKKDIEKWIKLNHRDMPYQYVDTTWNRMKLRGWKHFTLVENENCDIDD